MKSRALRGLLAAFAAAAVVPAAQAATPPAPAAKPRVLAVKFDNDVNPVTADYVIGEIHRANREHYNAVVILLDTPGGLSDAMKDINKAELASKIPVVVYVSPEGARAASAGVWISEAADILAMAPQTNIGSSTPINVGGENIQSDLRRKVVNDAAASLRALAQAHGRNVQWADAAVRKASNLSAREALRMNVIDVIAPTLPALLDKIDGTKTVPKGFVMHTANAEVTNVDMSLWKRILDLLVDPNIIALMLSIGLLGIVVELWNPGLIFPGTVGAISLIVGLFGLQVLPVSAAGLLLMVLAAGFFAAELFLPSHGALTLAGGICFFIGALMLFDPAGSAYQVSTAVALAITGTLVLMMAFVAYKITQARRAPVVTGQSELVGQVGIVREQLDPEGLVFVRGELWRARTSNGDALPSGRSVRVDGLDDALTLTVSPA